MILILNNIAQYLFILFPLLLHTWHDAGELNKGEKVYHGVNVLLMLVLALVSGLWLQKWAIPGTTWWRYMVYAFCLHFALFNYLINYFRTPRLPMHHLGKGPWDSLLLPLSYPVQIMLQSAVAIIGASVYYKILIFG